jgi:hypothetical protein
MTARSVLVGICCAALLTQPAAFCQSYDHAEMVLLQTMQRQQGDWERFLYLQKAVPNLSASDQILGQQLLASSESELGLYDQAILGFPLKSTDIPGLVLPTTAEWEAADAADTIAKLSSDRRLVLINEAHHNANTRVLTLALLPRLRALGFNYFAAEALSADDPGLKQRGYPVEQSGSEYLHEPLYGDIVREAIRLGFIIVPYDSDASGGAREAEQANNLYQRVFAKDPKARLFVHVGYAHIDKAKGRLGAIKPLAMQLQKLTGFDPLSIDQTQFLEVMAAKTDAYHQLTASFHSKIPMILVDRHDGHPWSAEPNLYNISVILPLSVSLKSFGARAADTYTGDISHLSLDMINVRDIHRPGWLTLSDARSPMPISADLCKRSFPCLVEARYAAESDEAIPADRDVFFAAFTTSRLYLRSGRYRLRVIDRDGHTLSEQTVQAPEH